MPEKSNVVLIKEFFGLKSGQTSSEFIGEFKQLTDQDKQQLADGIRNGSLAY